MNQYHISPQQQSGAVLITGLVLLLVLTLIGVTAMRSTTLEERMARNLREVNIAFQMSETGLRGGEDWINTRPGDRPIAVAVPNWAANQVYGLNETLAIQVATRPKSWWDDGNNTQAVAVVLDLDGDGTDDVESTPRFTVEEVDFVPDALDEGLSPPPGRMYYRITATGVAGRDETQSIVQSTFSIRQ